MPGPDSLLRRPGALMIALLIVTDLAYRALLRRPLRRILLGERARVLGGHGLR